MRIDIAGHHVDVTPPLREYVQTKMERVRRHFDQLLDLHVVLSVEKNVQRAEGTLKVSGSTLHAEADDQDMYAAIDALVDKLDKQVRRLKDRRTDHHHRKEVYKGAAPGEP